MTKTNLPKRFACGWLLCTIVGMSLCVFASRDDMAVPDPTIYEYKQSHSSEPSIKGKPASEPGIYDSPSRPPNPFPDSSKIEGKGKSKPGDTRMPAPEPGNYDSTSRPAKPFPGITNKPVSPRYMPLGPIPDIGIY